MRTRGRPTATRMLDGRTISDVSRVPRWAVGAAVAGSVVALAAVLVSPDAVLAWVATLRADPLLFGLAVIALYAVRPVVAWPLSLCSAVVGYGYGLVGLPLALACVCLSCLPAYALGRTADGGSGLLDWIGSAGERFFEHTGGVRGVVAARLAPLPAEPVSFGAGVSGIGLRAYLVGTLLGETPWTVAAVLAGGSVSRLATEGLAGVGIEFVVAAVAVAGLLLAGPAYEHLQDRHQNVSEQS